LAISREKKEAFIEKYVDILQQSDGIIIAEYRGLSVGGLEMLRRKIRENEGSFAVVKNTLAQRALATTNLPVPTDLLTGPVGIAFGHRNLAGVAKAMIDFAKENELLVIKGGVIGQHVIGAEAVKDLANMPSIEILRAQLLGLLNTPASRMVGVLSAPPRQMVGVLAGGVRQLVNVLNAYSQKNAA
jgi:large subunit ribosomal protein L10